jgi:Flp pilus assembly protein TadD
MFFMRLAAALIPALLAAACATTGERPAANAADPALQPGEPPFDRAARAAAGRQDMLSQMTFWAGEYQNHPKDLESAQKFVDALRLGGRTERAVAVAAEALEQHPADPHLLRAYGLSLLSAGKPQDALRPLALIAQGDASDWRIRSALGAALDQLNRPSEARAAYREALALKPDDPGVLTNLGVSYLMTGEPAQAEESLQKAAALPGAPAETRVNLAVAVALQGRFEEAERIQRVDLPPDMVAANMAYLRGLQSDPRRWDELRGGGGRRS